MIVELMLLDRVVIISTFNFVDLLLILGLVGLSNGSW